MILSSLDFSAFMEIWAIIFLFLWVHLLLHFLFHCFYHFQQQFARLYCRSTSISGSFSCSFIWAVAIKTVLMRLVRSFTSAGKLTFFGKDKQYITKTIQRTTCSSPDRAPILPVEHLPIPIVHLVWKRFTLQQYAHILHCYACFWCTSTEQTGDSL